MDSTDLCKACGVYQIHPTLQNINSKLCFHCSRLQLKHILIPSAFQLLLLAGTPNTWSSGPDKHYTGVYTKILELPFSLDAPSISATLTALNSLLRHVKSIKLWLSASISICSMSYWLGSDLGETSYNYECHPVSMNFIFQELTLF